MLKALSGGSDPVTVVLFLVVFFFFFLGGISSFSGDSACLPSAPTEVSDRDSDSS
jgi:phage shock protein PspC (stress-responsive transcriptional regulator)